MAPPDLPRSIRIASRTSPMALAQTRKVIAQLNAHFPDVACEIVGIISSGDRDKSTPLWQMNAVGVFTRELDEHVLSGDVDCAVHSFKDLGTQRPEGLHFAALLPRDDVRDVLLFHPDILGRITRGEEIVIGTSSPRRMLLLPPFLEKALPQIGPTPRVRAIPIRGNANTRIEKLLGLKPEAEKLSGIALALSGLSRLYADAQGYATLVPLLRDLKWMVVPLTVCPTAPGQGVVCVESRADRPDITALFAHLHNAQTASAVQVERDILLKHGGGCHQQFGASQIILPSMNTPVTLIRGATKDSAAIDEDRWVAPARGTAQKLWDGQEWATTCFDATALPYDAINTQAAFITHARACPSTLDPKTRVWVSGPSSWYKLAAKGLWVEGCADGFGFEFIRKTRAEPVLNLPALQDWAIYTHADAAKGWKEGQIVPTYKLTARPDAAMITTLQQAEIVWWGSATQYTAFAAHAQAAKLHACGPGRTAALLSAQMVPGLEIFPGHDAFLRWFHAR